MEKTLTKFIDCTMAARKQLAELFKVSEKTVYRALSYSGVDSDIKKRIRIAAKEFGGTDMVCCPEMETWFDSNGSMHQKFSNGWTIEVSKADGLCVVYDKNGKQKIRQANCTIAELSGIQESVAKAI